MANYLTKQGDMLDDVCDKYYGTSRNGVTEAVLQANPGLARHGPRMPAGLTITLPDIQTPAKAEKLVQLWD
jgi:phage tail protein X